MLELSKNLPRLLVAVAAICLVTLLGCDSQGSSDDEDPPPTNTGAEVTTAQHATLGSYLVDADERSLYLFTDEDGNPVPCTTDACVAAWPPFLTDGEPTADGGADASLLSTTERSDGTAQVVYNGWPLWYFFNDQAPGDVNGQGIESFGGIWYLVSAAGEKIEGSDDNPSDDNEAPPY